MNLLKPLPIAKLEGSSFRFGDWKTAGWIQGILGFTCLVMVSCGTTDSSGERRASGGGVAEVAHAPHSFLLERIPLDEREAFIEQWSRVPVPISMKQVPVEGFRSRFKEWGLLGQSVRMLVEFGLDRGGNVVEPRIVENPVRELDVGTLDRVILETVRHWKFARPAPMPESEFTGQRFYQPIILRFEE